MHASGVILRSNGKYTLIFRRKCRSVLYFLVDVFAEGVEKFLFEGITSYSKTVLPS